MNPTFAQINDLCKQPELVEEIIKQRNILRIELAELLPRIIEIEKKITEMQAITNELYISQ